MARRVTLDAARHASTRPVHHSVLLPRARHTIHPCTEAAGLAAAQQPMPFPGSGTSPPSVPAVVHVSAYLDRRLEIDDRAYTFEVCPRPLHSPLLMQRLLWQAVQRGDRRGGMPRRTPAARRGTWQLPPACHFDSATTPPGAQAVLWVAGGAWAGPSPASSM